MEKVKITREQEKALETWIRSINNNNLEGFINSKLRGKWKDSLKPLNSITPEQFSHMLNGWYEVEEPFEVGDWVYEHRTGKYHKVVAEWKGVSRTVSAKTANKSPVDVKKITEQWEIMLLELGRGKPEFHENDVLVTKKSTFSVKGLSEKQVIGWFDDNLVTAFYPAEHRIEVEGNAGG